MTVLITALRNDFVLSVADRRSSIQIGNSFVPKDERFNKHIYFACSQVKATATYTGIAQWQKQTQKTITTDLVVGNALSQMANKNANFGTTLYYLADTLGAELRWLKTGCRLSNPLFTIVCAGFSEFFAEPWIAVITNGNDRLNTENAIFDLELPSPYPFKIFFGVFSCPFVFLGGCTDALSQNTEQKLLKLLTLPHAQAFDVANLAVSEIRNASKNSLAVGERVSAIVLPTNGWLDTGLWDHPKEPLRGAMPRMVYPDGRQWEPSEIELQFEDVLIGEFQNHSLLFQSLSKGRTPNRIKRKMKKFRSSHKAPTIYQIIGESLFGIMMDEDGQNSPSLPECLKS